MKRLAIFVEGQTEQQFVSRLLREVAGEKKVAIDELRWRISKRGNRSFGVINASSRNATQEYYVLIFDCGGDSTVKTDILDNYESLARQNYQKIIGLRDVYPNDRASIPKLEYGLKYRVPTKPLLVNIILAIMEVEAWFLAETTHFLKIHSDLTVDRISKHLGFDPTTQNVEERVCPADDLNSIYHLVGFGYNKRKTNCQRTIDALDYSALYFDLRNKINRLGEFIQNIDDFFS